MDHYTDLDDELAVGSHPHTPDHVAALAARGVRAVVNLQSDEDLRSRAIQWPLMWQLYTRHGIRVTRVPIVDFDLTHRFEELIGRRFANRGFEDYAIREASQRIRFRLNEHGALLRSRAVLIGSLSVSRHLDFSQPHLVMLRKTGSRRPYFALWVATPELLVARD